MKQNLQMNSKKEVKTVKIQTQISLLIHGGTKLGFELAKTLLDQGSKVIIVDHFTKESKKYISQLKRLGDADFIDFNGIDDLYKNLPRVDYLFYLLNDHVLTNQNFTSKEFLEESNYLNQSLKAAEKYNSKVSLVSAVKLNKDLSDHMLNKSMSEPSPYSAVELQKYCETLAAEFRDKSKLNTRIIRLGTLMGNEIELITDPVIAAMVGDASKSHAITIKGEGLDNHYLVHLRDAVYGILKLTFTNKTEGEVITLANNHDYTTLSIAYKLLELDTEASQITFEDDETGTFKTAPYIPAENAEDFGWTQKITIEQSIIESLSGYDPKATAAMLKKISQKSKAVGTPKIRALSTKTPLGKFIDIILAPFVKSQEKTGGSKIKEYLTPANLGKWGMITLVSGVLFYFILSPVINISVGSYLLYSNLSDAYSSALSMDIDDAVTKMGKSENYLDRVSSGLERIGWVFTITGQEDLYTNSTQLLFGADYALNGAKELLEGTEPLSEYVKVFEPALSFQNDLPSTTREYREYLEDLDSNRALIENGAYSLLLSAELIEDVDISVFPEFIQDALVDLKEKNTQLSATLEPIYKTVTFLPDLLGKDERKRYLILLQNPGEIRATGGWASSYAILGIEGGQIRELFVDDIYNADGTLTLQGEQYEAPLTLQAGLDLKNWKMSLVNWDPDLPTTATAGEFFIEELGKGDDIDGLITIDTEFIKLLLEKWDGIAVTGETELVTAENMDEKIFQLHNEFTPGSTRKSTFLANLANETLKKLFSSNAEEYVDVSSVIYESLNQKSLQVYLKNSEAFDYFNQQGWAGKLKPTYTTMPFFVDWNWGGNKANLFLERSTTITANVADTNNIDYSYKVSIENQSTSRVYPQGDYTNYTRVYLPEDADLSAITGFENDEYDVYNEHGFRIVAGWFNVPVGSTQSLDIKYSLTSEEGDSNSPIASSGKTIVFNPVIYMQPGTLDNNVKVTIIYPDSWAALSHEGLTREVNTLSTQYDQEGDSEYNIVWEFK